MEERKERCIRCEKMRVGDLKHGFGNPRKITKKKAEELERSLEMFGDFGIFLIDENDNVIAGNQRSIILTKKDPDIMVDCKRLIGYTDAELRDIYFMAKEQGITIPVGIRVTFDAGNDLKSRFGIDIDSDDFSGAMGFFQHNTHLEFRGFQCHIGSARQPKYWKNKIDRMIELAKTYGAKYIDLGGGMFGPMAPELAEQFNGYAYGGYEEYAQIIAGAMKKAFPDEDVMLMIEPGTALVGNTMKMAATITNIKFVRGQIYLTANCASNHMGVIADMKKLVPEVVHMNDNACTFTDVIIGGDTCLEYDYLVKGISGEFAIGDRLVFDNVGAYSISSSRQFIVPRPKVVSEVTGEVLREAEGFTDMFGRYLEKTSEHRMKNA